MRIGNKWTGMDTKCGLKLFLNILQTHNTIIELEYLKLAWKLVVVV